MFSVQHEAAGQACLGGGLGRRSSRQGAEQSLRQDSMAGGEGSLGCHGMTDGR